MSVKKANDNAESGSNPTINWTSIDTVMYTSNPGFGRGGPIEVQRHATGTWIDTVVDKER